MRLNDIKTVDEFSDYIMGVEYQDEFDTYKEWCDALEPVITRLQGDHNSECRMGFFGDEPIRLYRSQTNESIARDGYGMHWVVNIDDTLGDANLMMDFDVHLPYIAFWNWLDGMTEVVIPQSSLAKCTIMKKISKT